MKRLFLLILIGLLSIDAFSQTTSINPAINEVLEEIKTFNKRENAGDTINSSHPFGRSREEDFIRRGQFYKKAFDKLNGIDETKLGFNDQINLALLKYQINDELISYEYKEYLNPILSDEGFHTSLARIAP